MENCEILNDLDECATSINIQTNGEVPQVTVPAR